MTARAASATPAWSSTRPTTHPTPAAWPVRSPAARRSTSVACAWTRRSSRGAWKVATAWAATTCCGASTTRRPCDLVVAAEPVPQIELDALLRELARPLARRARQAGLQGRLLADARLEGLLAAEAGG